MRFLCLIHLDPAAHETLPGPELDDLNGRHLELNDALRASGHFIEAEALEPATKASTVRVRGGKVEVRDGPFAEAKEVVAGFYLLEARDLAEAQQIAARIPSAPLGTVEIRQVRQLIVPGR